MAADLKELAAIARAMGWASGSGDIDSIRKQAASLRWAEVTTRRGEGAVSVLRPVDTSAAHPSSLSATYGLGQQPLHTDGAHLTDPPDLVVLISQQPSTTPTKLWPGRSRGVRRLAVISADTLRHGMFLVHNGRDSFYARAMSRYRYRYDPGCMTACDARAREVSQWFADQLPRADAYEWSDAGEVLVIDNYRTLHARAAVADGDIGRELTRIAFRTEAAQ